MCCVWCFYPKNGTVNSCAGGRGWAELQVSGMGNIAYESRIKWILSIMHVHMLCIYMFSLGRIYYNLSWCNVFARFRGCGAPRRQFASYLATRGTRRAVNQAEVGPKPKQDVRTRRRYFKGELFCYPSSRCFDSARLLKRQIIFWFSAVHSFQMACLKTILQKWFQDRFFWRVGMAEGYAFSASF